MSAKDVKQSTAVSTAAATVVPSVANAAQKVPTPRDMAVSILVELHKMIGYLIADPNPRSYASTHDTPTASANPPAAENRRAALACSFEVAHEVGNLVGFDSPHCSKSRRECSHSHEHKRVVSEAKCQIARTPCPSDVCPLFWYTGECGNSSKSHTHRGTSCTLARKLQALRVAERSWLHGSRSRSRSVARRSKSPRNRKASSSRSRSASRSSS
jgi:hypothetical protein